MVVVRQSIFFARFIHADSNCISANRRDGNEGLHRLNALPKQKNIQNLLVVYEKTVSLHSHLAKCAFTESVIAEIAQLVEHDLAKVGVAGSSPVFRSFIGHSGEASIADAQVAELVDAHVSGACVERRAGSSPVLGTDNAAMNMSERWRNW